MRKSLIATTALAIALSLGTGSALADGRPGNYVHAHHDGGRAIERRGEVRRPGPRVEVLRVDLNRRYWNESIPLRRLLGLGPDYRGYRVQSVTVKLRSPRRHHYRHNSHYGGGHGHFQHRPARLSLLTNGYVADRARAGGSRRIKLYPGENDVLGREIGRMQLAVRGRAFIDSIKVELSPPRPRHFKGRGRGHRANGDNYDVNEHLAATVFRIILNNIELADGRH